jgi:hypothetical protein
LKAYDVAWRGQTSMFSLVPSQKLF